MPAAVQGKPQLQEDAQHTGRSPYAGPRQLQVARSFQAVVPSDPATSSGNNDVQSDLVIGPDGTIYLSTFPGSVLALADGSGSTLALKWQFHQPKASGFHSSPILSRDGSLVTGVSGGTPPSTTLYDLKGDQPQTAWKYDLGAGRMTSSITVGPDGTMYAISGPGKLAALNPDGTAKWTSQAGPSEHAAPGLAGNGVVYAPSTDGNLYALVPGGVLWTFAFGDRPGIPTRASAPGGGGNGKGSSTAPTVGPDGTVYVGANNSDFYAVNPDGSLKWKYEAEPELAGIWSGAALSADGKTVYFGANKGGIYAVDTESGKLVWQAPLFGGSVYASPTLDKNGTLYVGSTTGHVFALDSKTGAQLAVADTHGAVWTTPSIRPDGTLVLANRKGQVIVYSA